MATSIARTKKNPRWLIWVAIVGGIALLGVGLWIFQLTQNSNAAGLSNLEPWGLYISGFVFFVGLSAGLLCLAALPILLNQQKFISWVKISVLASIAALVVGGLFILIDLGRPERVWELLVYAHPGSPMFWDVCLTALYLVVGVLFLWRLVVSPKMDFILRALAWLALLAGITDSVNGFIFSTQVSREFWFSAVQPIAFFVAAVASAGAFLLLLWIVLEMVGFHSNAGIKDFRPLTLLTAVAIGTDLFFIASELVTLGFSRSQDSLALVQGIATSPLFWIEIVTAVCAIILLISPKSRTGQGWIAIAASSALIDLAVKRFLFVQMGFIQPNISFPGAALFPTSVVYLPTPAEWGIVLGLVSLFAFVLTLGFRVLKIDERGSR